jgi:hypothetical protein
MNQTETASFFNVLWDLVDLYRRDLHDVDPEFLEGYDYVMDIVKDAILDNDEVGNLADLDNFVNQVDAYADDFNGEYGRGYQMAVEICLETISKVWVSQLDKCGV